MTNTYRKKNSGRNPLSEHIRTPTGRLNPSYSAFSNRALMLGEEAALPASPKE